MPADAIVNLPGCALASLISSCTVCAGTAAFTTSISGDCATMTIGVKSLTGSYGTLAKTLGFTTNGVSLRIRV